MKKLLILLLTICSISGFSQILIDPTLSITTKRSNDAAQGAVIVSGTDTYTATYLNTGNSNTGITSYSGLALTVQFANPNTTTATFELNGLGPKTIKKQSGGALVSLSANDIGPNERKDIYYDGTYIVLKGGTGSGGAAGALLSANNLSDLANASTARTNLGLGTLATQNGTSPSGTIVGTSDTQTLTNKTIAAGSNTITGLTNSNLSGTAAISNANLANSVITIAGASTALGSSITLDGITGLSTTGFLKRTGANALTAGSLVSGDIPNNAANTSGSAGSVGNALSIAAELISGGATTYNGSAAKSIGIQSASVTNGMLAGSIDLTTKVTGTLPVVNGGTGVTSSSGASSVVIRDANQNIVANNSTLNSTSVTTAAGTTTLTNASSRTEFFTGTTTQTVLLPVTSTLALNWTFEFINNSTGIVIVQSSGANTIQAMEASSMMTCKCISTSGTGTSSWDCRYSQAQPMTTFGDILYGGDPGVTSIAPLKRLGPSTPGYTLYTNGSGSAPYWGPTGTLSGLTTNGVLVATSSTTAGTVSDLVYGSRSLTVGLSTAGTNTLNMTNSGATGFTLNLSTGEFRMAAQSSHFTTFYSSGSERIRINTSGNIITAATASSVFRTTNAGSDVNAHFMIDPANSLTSGKGYGFETTNGLVFTQGNGTRRISYAMIQATGLTSTAGSEAGGLAILAQSGGTAPAQVATFTAGGVNIKGTTTNDAAASGYIGENFRGIQSTYTNYTTTATYQNITSITLPAGDYEISASFTFNSNSATITAASDAIFVISTTTASASGATEGESVAYIPQAALLGTSHESGSIAPYRVSLSGSTTYYLNTQSSFTVGNPQFVGSIRALRVR